MNTVRVAKVDDYDDTPARGSLVEEILSSDVGSIECDEYPAAEQRLRDELAAPTSAIITIETDRLSLARKGRKSWEMPKRSDSRPIVPLLLETVCVRTRLRRGSRA